MSVSARVPWSKKVVVRCMSDGTFARMHPAGFGARFGSGPYPTIESAASAPMSLYVALDLIKPSATTASLTYPQRSPQSHPS